MKRKKKQQRPVKVSDTKVKTNRNVDQVPDEELKDQRRASIDYRNDLYERGSQ
jgi:hypothetical protein